MEVNSKSFTEVYYYINQLSDEIFEKIPKQIIDNIISNMDKAYIPNIRDLSEEAKVVISVIYTEYLCAKDEKEKWEDLDKLYMKKIKKNC